MSSQPVDDRGGQDPRHLRVPEPAEGRCRPDTPLTHRRLLEALIQRGVDLDKPLSVGVFVREAGDGDLACYSYQVHDVGLCEEDGTLELVIGEGPYEAEPERLDEQN